MSKLLTEYNPVIARLLEAAKSDDMYVVARWHQRDYYVVIWRNHMLDESIVNRNAGVGLYVFTKAGHVAFGSTNDLTEDGVITLYEELRDAARTNETLGIAKSPEIYKLEPQENLGEDALHYQHKDLLEYELAELPKILAEYDVRISELYPEANLVSSADVEQDIWRIVRSDGTDVDFSLPKIRLRQLNVTLRDGEQTTQAYHRGMGTTVAQLRESLKNTDEHFESSIQESLDQLKADAVVGGSPAVLMDAELIGMIAHEALGHPAESDIIASGASVLGDDESLYKQGLKVAEPFVQVTDHEESLNHGFHPYGAFGNARESVTIVKDGKLHESISDIFSAERIGVANKNCERSESYSAPAVPRMSNTYVHIDNNQDIIESPDASRPEIAQQTLIENGIFKDHPTVLYIEGMRGGSVNPAGGTFMFGTRYVYELTATSITPRKPVSFSGDALSALQSIKFAAGNIDTSDFGYCGKASQTAHVNSGGNALVFLAPNDKLTVA